MPVHYDERWKRYILPVDDEADKRIGKFLEGLYWILRTHSGVLDPEKVEICDRAIKRLLKIVEKVDWENMGNILFLVDTLVGDYGAKAVEVALNRELHLRRRVVKRGGRPSIVKKYCDEIDSIHSRYRDNSLLSRKENIRLRIEQIKRLLKEVKEKHSRATYLKVRKYALEKIEDLEWELSLWEKGISAKKKL